MIIAAKGEEKIRDIPINQSNYTTEKKKDKAPSHSTQRTKPLGEHVHTTAHTRAHMGAHDLPLAGGEALKG